MLFLAIGSFFYASPAAAHAPRLLDNDGSVTIIEQPDVSQAFYGDLKNGPAFFSLKVDKPMDLYVSILVPNVAGIKKDKSVQIKYDNQGKDEIFWTLDGKNFAWRPWYERFGGDNYFQGPEIKKMAQPGEYFLAVYSGPDYVGKYVLVVGEKESFTLTDIVNTIFTLPTLKRDFFEKSPWLAYFNLTGVFMAIGILVLVIVYLIISSILKKVLAKKIEPEKLIRPSDDLHYRQ